MVELAVQIILARLLEPTDFGALAIMLVFVNVGGVFVTSGLPTALIQANEVDDTSYSTVFWISLVVSTVLYCVIFLLAPTIALFYRMPQIVWPLRALCAVLLVNAYNSVQVAKVTRELELRKTFVSTMTSVFVSGTCGAITAIAGGGLWALVIQQLLYAITNCLTLAVQVSWHPTKHFRPEEGKTLFAFGWKLLAAGLLETGYNSLSDLIVGARFSVESLGVMSQGKKYPQALGGVINGSVQPVMLATVSHVSSDMNRARAITRRALKSSCYLVMPVMSFLACSAPALIPALLGNQWRDAVPYFQVFCVVNAFLPMHTTNLQALNAMGRSDLFLKLEIVKKTYGVMNLLFCAFVLGDIWLLCCSYLVTNVVSQVVNAWPNKRVLGYGYTNQIKDIAPGLLLSALGSSVAITVGFFGFSSMATIVLQAIVFVLIYLGASALFHVEAYEYLLRTAHELLISRK